jgi:hypothetical protein
MEQAKCIKKSTNVRRFGEKVTHRYSVDALNFFYSKRKSNACLADEGDFEVG